LWGRPNSWHSVATVVVRFDQSIDAFVPLAMARGHQMGVIEVVVRYQLSWSVCLAKLPFQHPYEAPSSGAGQDREVDLVCMWCFTPPTPSRIGR